MSVINTNTKSMFAQNAMVKNDRDLANTMQQLSTGKRINSFKDDSAGIAVSTRMSAQITGLDQAVRNGNEAVSMLQTAEGAMSEMTNMMQRMRELAVQSSNDTYTAKDREYMNQEFQQLKAEVGRVTENTEWNGMPLLNGSTQSGDGAGGKFDFQVGDNKGQIITHTIANMGFRAASDNAGSVKYSTPTPNVKADAGTTPPTAAVAQVSKLTLEGIYKAGDEINFTVGGTTKAYTVLADDVKSTNNAANLTSIATKLATAAGAAMGGANVTQANNVLTFTAAVAGTEFAVPTAEKSATFSTATANVKADAGTTPPTVAVAQVSKLTLDGVYKAGDEISFTVGGETKSYKVLDSDVTSSVNEANLATIAGKLLTAAATPMGSTNVTQAGKVLTFTAETAGTEFKATSDVKSPQGASLSNLNALTLLTSTAAESSMAELDVAIERVSSERSGIGAVINRLNAAVDNLANVSLNATESRSRIMDTDYAKASSALARSQIISQAATAMLAQANQQPQSVMKLLQG